MNDFVVSFAYWLADYYLATTLLLGTALLAMLFMRQPAKRLAVTKSAIVAAALLGGLCALPGWSLVSLGGSESMEAPKSALLSPPQPAAVQSIEAPWSPALDRFAPIVNVSSQPVALPVETGWEVSWLSMIVGSYLVGSASILFWLVAGAVAAARLVRRADYFPDKLRASLTGTVGVGQLLVSEEVDVPVAIGVFRPRILLPRVWIDTRSSAELATVLAHEAAHIRNGDLKWLAASRVLLIALWAQPLYWWLRRWMRLDQETLADAAAAEVSGRQAYAELLVAWARDVVPRRQLFPASVGLWEGASQLRRRVALLVDEGFSVLSTCPLRWRRGAVGGLMVAAVLLSLFTLEPGHSELLAGNQQKMTASDAAKVGAAIRVLRETEGIGERRVAGIPVADDWAKAIRALTEVGPPAVPALIESLDEEQRDHAISKLAFALRAIGDPRAVPALIRAIPRTLVPSRSDFGLRIADPKLLVFMQHNDLTPANEGDDFDYGRAFREVVAALHKLSGTDQNDMELNWVHLGETEPQRRIQRRLFQQLAEKWADWWTEHWQQFDVDESFAEVDLPRLVESAITRPVASIPSGDKLGLTEGHSEWIVEPARESGQRCFVDLDTSRQGDWPMELVPVSDLGMASEQANQWAREQGFDLVGIRYQPAGYESPLYCLQPIDLKVWEVSPEEQSQLMRAMRGEIPYPLGRPVDLIVPRKQDYEGPDKNELGGTAFLFLTREGTAGLLRMTAQVSDTKVPSGNIHSSDDQYSPIGFYRGAKISFSIIAETDKPQEVAGSDRTELRILTFAPSGPPQAPVQPQRLDERGAAGAALPQDSIEAAPMVASRSTANVATQHTVSGIGTTATFVVGNPATPWDYKPNVLAIAVEDEAGEPLEGVEEIVYRVAPQSGERVLVKRSTTDAEGEVEFIGLVDAERAAEFQARAAKSQFPLTQGDIFYVVLRQEGKATVILPVSDFTLASRGVKRSVRMRPAVELGGRVTDREGKPVEGATVAAGSIAGFLALEGDNAVKTDADGRYRFNDRVAFNREAANKRIAEQNRWSLAADRDPSKLYPAVYDPAEDTSVSDLYVTHPDFAVTTVRGGNVPGVTDVVMAPAASIEGRVVEFGTDKPVAGIRVQTVGRPTPAENESSRRADDSGGDLLFLGSWHNDSTQTDSAGAYRLANLPEGSYEVWAEEASDDGRKAARVSRGVVGIAATGGAPATKAPDLVLGPGGVIRGRLVDAATGKPLEVGDVELTAKAVTQLVDPFRRQNSPLATVPVDRDGRFELRTLPGALRVFLMVNTNQADSNPQGDFCSSVDAFEMGAMFDLKHGESVDAKFPVWPRAKLEEARAALIRGFEKLNQQKYDDAIAAFDVVIGQERRNESAIRARAEAYERAGRLAEATAEYERIVATSSDGYSKIIMMNNLASLLATNPNTGERDGKRAVELSTQAIAMAREAGSGFRGMAELLDTLASGQAEAGDFEAAAATEREAIGLAPEQLQQGMRERLKLYEARELYRRPFERTVN